MTIGSNTTGIRRVAGWVAPSRRVDRSAAIAATRSMSSSPNAAPTSKPYPVWVSSRSPASATLDTELVVRRIDGPHAGDATIAISSAASP